MAPPPNRLAECVAELVRIPSVNPMQSGPKAEAAGPVGERALANHLATRLERLGATEVVLDVVEDDRPNIYATFAGRTDRVVVLDVHLDTVTVEHMIDPPFDGRIEAGCVWGRGSLDTKASLGVMLAVLEQIAEEGTMPEPTLLVVGTVGEESGGLTGAARFRQWADANGIDVDQMIVAEPTRLAPIHGHKGGAAFTATAVGETAHSSLPELGKNAIEAIVPVIQAIQAEHGRLQELRPDTELGNGTLSVTLIEGGTGSNVIPDRCTVTIGRRIVPGESAQEVYDRLCSIVAEACPLPVEIESLLPPDADGTMALEAFYMPPDTPLVQSLAEWAGTAPTVAPFGTNALRYAGFGTEVAIFGPGSIDEAHKATECVAIADLEMLAECYRRWLTPS